MTPHNPVSVSELRAHQGLALLPLCSHSLSTPSASRPHRHLSSLTGSVPITECPPQHADMSGTSYSFCIPLVASPSPIPSLPGLSCGTACSGSPGCLLALSQYQQLSVSSVLTLGTVPCLYHHLLACAAPTTPSWSLQGLPAIAAWAYRYSTLFLASGISCSYMVIAQHLSV